ncbi:MAG: hypothetical protein COB50_03260 [Thiotrichales bacterium]|nr:MAG: hypothetical protein COB50_03260 [Thiotrichales bacterium]
MPSIAFIESNTTGTGEKFIIAAKELGLQVIFATINSKKYSFLETIDLQLEVIDTSNTDSLYEYLANIADLVGITSTSERFICNAAVVAKQLGLPHTDPAAIKNCRDKFKLNNILNNAKLPAISSSNNIDHDFSFPVVVKPNTGTGSIGVKLCNSQSDIIKHINSLENKSEILIQEYIVGDEYSAEVVAMGGEYYILGITKKYLGPEPYFVEISHDFPANISTRLHNNIVTTVNIALQAVGFDFGPAHIEFRVFNNKVYIIEINPRLAGGMIPILIEYAQDIELIKKLVKLFINQPVGFAAKTGYSTKISFIIPEQEGCIENIALGIKNNHIVEKHLYKNIGDLVTLKGDFSDRIGFIIAKADNIADCRAAINSALSGVEIKIT